MTVTTNGIIPEPNDEQLQLARAWHGGQGSMLYAVASVGKLELDDAATAYEWRTEIDEYWAIRKETY